MNCPKCNSADMMRVGKLMWCKDCQYSYDASADPKANAGTSNIASEPSDDLPAGMMKCPVCSHLVSSKAISCPSCGEPLRRAPFSFPLTGDDYVELIKRSGWMIVVAILVCLFVIALFKTVLNSYRPW